jgi:hypothetical protein
VLSTPLLQGTSIIDVPLSLGSTSPPADAKEPFVSELDVGRSATHVDGRKGRISAFAPFDPEDKKSVNLWTVEWGAADANLTIQTRITWISLIQLLIRHFEQTGDDGSSFVRSARSARTEPARSAGTEAALESGKSSLPGGSSSVLAPPTQQAAPAAKKKRIIAPRPRHGEDGPPRFSDQELEEQLASRQEDSGGMSVS